MTTDDIPKKATHILKLAIIAFLLIALRVWHLTFIEHENYLQKGRKPLERVVSEKPMRGPILDRFGLPLAINRVQYDVFLLYNPIRSIPSRIRSKSIRYPRRDYVEKLAYRVANELSLNPVDVEDFIYSKAAIFPNTPMLLKADVSEKMFCRLKALEKDWPGLHTMRVPKRYYPAEKVASHIVGYMGKVDSNTYFGVARELKELTEFVQHHYSGVIAPLPRGYATIAEVERRVQDLKNIAYRMDDHVGKWGIEKSYEESLRGSLGKSLFLVDTLDQKRHRLPGGRATISGSTLQLTISAELQEYAEQLLAENEAIRDNHFSSTGKYRDRLPPPWIKGGGIVALDPNTGAVVACASYPRFDPNDFISSDNVSWKKWLESPDVIADIWDGKSRLEKETYDFKKKKWQIISKPLNWSTYLNMILGKKSSLHRTMFSIKTIGDALRILESVNTLLDLSEQASIPQLIEALYRKNSQDSIHIEIRVALSQHSPLVEEARKILDPYFQDIPNQRDRILFIDLLHLATSTHNYSNALRKLVDPISLDKHRQYTQSASIIEETVRSIVYDLFRNSDFYSWREENFSEFIMNKRQDEKRRGTYEHPYTEYLQKEESRQFQAFFTELRSFFMQAFIFGEPPVFYDESLEKYMIYLQDRRASTLESNSTLSEALKTLQEELKPMPYELATEYLDTMVPFSRLKAPIFTTHRDLKGRNLQALARAFYPYYGFSYCNSYAFNNSAPLGSTFKIVTALEGLRQHYEKHDQNPPSMNPLTIIDEIQPHTKTPNGIVLGFTEEGKKITRRYKGGRLPRSHSRFGRVDFQVAMERSSNIYYSLLAGDIIDKPESLLKASEELGLGVKTGIDLPGESKGMLPKDVCEDKSALYAFAIGQHRFLSTPLQAASFLSTLANFGDRLKPNIVQRIHFETMQSNFHEQELLIPLNNVGLQFPFFIKTLKDRATNIEVVPGPIVSKRVNLEEAVRNYLFSSMQRVMIGERGSARPSMIRYLLSHPEISKKYVQTSKEMIGKTSTAEVFFKPTFDRESKGRICNHIWFGGISFEPSEEEFSKPELAVVVFLPYGDYGKEAAPLAALIIDKWRELKKRYSSSCATITSPDASLAEAM